MNEKKKSANKLAMFDQWVFLIAIVTLVSANHAQDKHIYIYRESIFLIHVIYTYHLSSLCIA